MKSSQRSDSDGNGLIILNKLIIDPKASEFFRTIGLAEPPALVFKAFSFENDNGHDSTPAQNGTFLPDNGTFLQ